MKLRHIYTFIGLLLSFTAWAQVPSPAPAQQDGIVITGATLHIGNGNVVEQGAIAFENGKILYVGTLADMPVELAELVKVEAHGKHVYPGLILLNTFLGLEEISAVNPSKDFRELGTVNPEVRSIIAYNTDSHLTPTNRSNGVLVAQITPRGGLFPGTSSVVQLDAWNWEDAVVKMDEGIHLNWPFPYVGPRWWMGESQARENKSYQKNIEIIEQTLKEAKAYAAKSEVKEINLKLEALKGLFDGSKKLYINVDMAKDIIKSVQLVKELGVENVVLVGVKQGAYVSEFIKDHNIPCIVERTHSLPFGEDASVDSSYDLPNQLVDAGILVGLAHTGEIMGERNLAFGAGTAAAFGMEKEEALQLLTLNNAKILGIEDQMGSLEVGKDATLLISEGDLLDMRGNKVSKAYIQGRDLDLDNKHEMLYRKFKAKYEKKPLVN